MRPTDINVVLYQPVIPQNTGSIARLCACTGATLHLIHPLGFQTDEKAVRRAGLDYWDHVAIKEHANWERFLESETPERLYFLTKFAKRPYTSVQYETPVYFVFGSETSGLPPFIHEQFANGRLLIPMRTHLVRSLNLAQAAAIMVYEALRQVDFSPIQLPAPERLA